MTVKLGIKPGHKMLALNVPDGHLHPLGLPEGVETKAGGGGAFDFVLTFVSSKAEVDALAPMALKAVKPGCLLWFAYPKKTSKVKTDVTRDTGWDALRSAGLRPVTQIAIDDTWSALRFRPESEVKPRPRFSRTDDASVGRP